ncbi:hypothetical protein P7C70_g6803, partial [Phenoliferia sp. Uapishka_3]
MGRKKDGYVNAKKKVSGKGKGRATAAKRGTGVASLTPLAPSTYLCGTCDRKLLPGAPYEIHGKKCRLKAANAADHAARVLDTAGATARLAGMKAAEIAARLAPVEGSDDEEHWSDYEFGGGGEDELGGHDKFDWGSAPEGTGSPRSRATTPSEGTPEFDEVDAVLGQKPGQVEFRTINGVTLECHLPASVLKDPAWKNTRPPPTQVPYRSPSPKKKKTTTRKGAREDRPRPSPTPAPGDSGIPGDGTNPWHPFQTWTDFKVAQTLKDLGASGAKIDKFLGVLNDRRFKVSEMRIATAKKLEECLAYGRSLARAPVPRNRQKDLTTIFEARSMEEARAVQAEYTRLAAARRKGEAEALLKQHSTYRHTSALSLLKQPDIHKAIGNDELHRDASGNWGKHVVPVIVDQAGDDGGRLLDARIQVYPTFPGLRAFSDFTGKPWVDASYYRALHAVVLFIAPGTLGTHEHHLLKLIRYWAIMHQYDGLHIQTDDTLAKLQVVISRIELIMKRIAQLCRKSIDYPKFHNLGKVVARMKLVAVGKFTSTRVGEELHRDDHAFYKTSNKRDVTEQLVRQHEGKEIMDLIEGQAQRLALASNPPPPVKPKPRILPGSDDKVERRWPFGHFEELKRDVDVYNNFALKIRTLLYDPAGAKPKERPRMSAMPVISDCSISNYHLLHIRFTRIDNWEEGHDIARCHEIFGEKKRPRYDSVIYNPHHISLAEHDPAETDLYFGRLISVFRLTGPGGVSYRPMALVQNFVVEGRDESTWCLLGDEVDELNCSVIWCDSIVRACHTPPKPHDEMAPTTKKNAHDLQHDKGAFFINEFIDRDAYFRLKYALGVDLGTLESDYFDQVARENEEFVPPAAGPEGEDEEESYLGLDGPEDEELNEGDF